jgi:uncharacterized membrane protein
MCNGLHVETRLKMWERLIGLLGAIVDYASSRAASFA